MGVEAPTAPILTNALYNANTLTQGRKHKLNWVISNCHLVVKTWTKSFAYLWCKYLDNVKYVPEEGLSKTIPPKLLTILLVNFCPVLSFKLSKAGSSKFEKSEGCRSYRIIIRSIGLLNMMHALDSVNSPVNQGHKIKV